MFTFPQITDSLILSGATQRTYLIEVTYIVSNGFGQTVHNKYLSFNLTIKNPCIDPDKIQILTHLAMPAQYSYTLFENNPALTTIESISLLELEPKICMVGL